MVNQYKIWSNNRGRNTFQKIAYWKRRRIGALIRSIEFLAIRTPLQNLIRSHNDINEIRHLLTNFEITPGSNDYVINGARVSTVSGLVLLESGHVIARQLDSHAYLSGSLIDEVRVLTKGREKNEIKGLILFVPMQSFFYHFLIDFLPYLLRAAKTYEGLKIVVHRDNPEFVFNYFKLHQLNFQTTSKTSLNIESLLAIDFTGMKLLEAKQYLQLPTKVGESSLRRIAFLRYRGARFDADLEEKISLYLVNEGYSVIDPDCLSEEQQISFFSRAEEVAAIHGGVLANLIYCNERVKVLEIFSHPYRTYFFQELARELNLDYKSMEVHDFS